VLANEHMEAEVGSSVTLRPPRRCLQAVVSKVVMRQALATRNSASPDDEKRDAHRIWGKSSQGDRR
jgi:hypothetical protein